LSNRGLILALLALVALLACSLLAFEVRYRNRIYPGVSIWGMDVGGLRPEAETERLASVSELEEPLVFLVGPERDFAARPSDLGFQLEPASTLAQAYDLGRAGSEALGWLARLELLAFGADLPPVLTYDEAETRRYLETIAAEVDLEAVDATLSFEGVTPVAETSRPGRRLDAETTLAFLRPALMELEPIQVELVMEEVPPAVTGAEEARSAAEGFLSGPLTLTLVDPREGDPGPWEVPPEQLVEMLVVRAEDGVLQVDLDHAALELYLEKLAPALSIEPIDARFHFDEATKALEPITASEVGRALDVEGSVARIEEALEAGKREVSIAVEDVPPAYPDTALAEEVGITDLVATGESYFIGSPSGRDHNIRLAAKKFDGVVVPTGETFSFNEHLGEVTSEAGYDESFITAGEQLAMGVGGGICQVSTTAFRAAFWGGYPITERWYHGQRVGYYELRGGGVGMDATVYSPHVDLKFVNDRSAPLLIETEVGEGTHRLVFRFYSTDDGRRVEMEGPVVTNETEPGTPIYELDETMAPGSVTKWQSSVGGLTATIERTVYDASGDVIHQDTFVSEYEPRRAAFHYGPGYQLPE